MNVDELKQEIIYDFRPTAILYYKQFIKNPFVFKENTKVPVNLLYV